MVQATKNFKKGLCNIKTKIPKKSTELEGQDRQRYYIFTGAPNDDFLLIALKL